MSARRKPSCPVTLVRLDHLVLTVRDVAATISFYEEVLGMEPRAFGEDRIALHFGNQKINLHPYPSTIEPKAATSLPGSVDVCLIAETPIEKVKVHLLRRGVVIEHGPVTTRGALGKMCSLYFRDPDANLIEVANYLEGGADQ